jgi:predicted nuclease of predicted toxin-antitoxin system
VKFLANMGISPKTVILLRSLGHDAVRLNEVGLDQAEDSNVIAHAAEQTQIILTFDLDYPMLLALAPERRASSIVFRTTIAEGSWINARLAACLPLVENDLREGAIVVVEDDRIRIRKFADL